MRSYFSTQRLQTIGFCLFIILLSLLALLYAQIIWQLWEQLTITINSSVSRASDYLVSLSN